MEVLKPAANDVLQCWRVRANANGRSGVAGARQAVPRDRHLLRAQRIRRRLGGSPNMLEDFPPKPKGMHWQRYKRMRDVHDLAQDKAMMGLMQFVDHLECRVGIRR